MPDSSKDSTDNRRQNDIQLGVIIERMNAVQADHRQSQLLTIEYRKETIEQFNRIMGKMDIFNERLSVKVNCADCLVKHKEVDSRLNWVTRMAYILIGIALVVELYFKLTLNP